MNSPTALPQRPDEFKRRMIEIHDNRTKAAAEVTIEPSLVRALLHEQHPDLAQLALIDIGEGWDNKLFRLGDDLAVRLPRRAASAALIEQEQRWLPQLSPRLPLPVPVPLRIGRPGSGFPWSWSVVPWFVGESALFAPPQDTSAMVAALGQFLRALHQPAPDDANPWRGVPIATRTTKVREHVRQLNGLVDGTAVLSLWERVVSAPSWSGPPDKAMGALGRVMIDAALHDSPVP